MPNSTWAFASERASAYATPLRAVRSTTTDNRRFGIGIEVNYSREDLDEGEQRAAGRGQNCAPLYALCSERLTIDPRVRRRLALRDGAAVCTNISAIFSGDVRFPTALAAIHDPPQLLWIRGDVGVLRAPAVAVVGSRAASPYALEVARRLGADLARRNVTVVSGMARGVDSAAHRGALEGGGVTVAVFGCGADIIYPREHAALANSICERGALVSEFPPGTRPLKGHFPQRNRIISGMSLAVVVCEAAEGSGSLITAEFALEQGRAVLAVPGNVLGRRNRGAH